MKRKIYDKLLEWKQGNGESALLIDGARRVGKSYIAEEFGKNEYRSYILIDFNKVDPEVKEWFNIYLNDLDTLFVFISNYFGTKLYPRESLIILDEVNECPRARAAIKYLVADKRYDFIETGSLISITKNVEGIMIPSEEDHLKMYPMDFEEFLWAIGQDTLMDLIKNQFEKLKPLGQAMHRKVMTYLRQYVLIGGMPQAVAKWIETQNFNDVDKIKQRILALYRADIAKHAGRFRQRTENIFDTIPSQLSKHEKVFKLASINKQARMREYENAFLWLQDAMMVNVCYNSTEPNIGLRLNEDRTTMKCYLNDTGLLISLAFANGGSTSHEIYQKLLTNKLEVNKGMLIENLVAQMLVAKGHNLFFFSNPSPEDVNERMEIDFLIQKAEITSRHNISPIEVKSAQRYTQVSLDRFRSKYSKTLSTSYVMHSADLEQKEGILYLPLYMTPLL
ncbi:MAG: AAA family ATPase [Bacteroidales bacterium]|nr:AAA family ATPase [Bacteroidales bacterium]